jgi:3-deoxy-D-manno-octulosonic-acid transferase
MLILYNLFLSFYYLSARLYGLFNAKAKKWVDGRKDWEDNYRSTLRLGEKRVWVHCSSMGEFEQAKPLIEELRQQYPAYKMVVTFFSPSGYEACKNNSLADYVFYLPHDSKQNAKRFIEIVAPSVAMFVKYEFWYYYLMGLKSKGIPTLLVSGAFRKDQVFLKWYGGMFRDMLRCFSFFFLQDAESLNVLTKAGITPNIFISGDTRYDRVSTIAKNVTPITTIDNFRTGHKILIAGSTWPGDEEVLKDCLGTLPADWKLIIVPHEIDDAHIHKVQQLFRGAILFSELDAENTGSDKKVMIVNNIGMLSRLFAYADIAFIGGGFQKGGIHNILEPAVFGAPVIFGPVYEKFVEAKELASLRYVFPVANATECNEILNKLITDHEYHGAISYALKEFMKNHTGAAALIIGEINREGWLA